MEQQGTDEWRASRCGFVTASRISDVMAKIKMGEAGSRKNYKAQLVAERLTGVPCDSFISDAMRRGTELEPIARAEYELRTGRFVDETGFVRHPVIEYSGASPDGLVGDDGIVEIKCPNTATHIDYLISKNPPKDYFYQMQWQMECTGRLWCDWVSFDDRMPKNLEILIVRIDKDQHVIDIIKQEVSKFLLEVDELVKKLKVV